MTEQLPRADQLIPRRQQPQIAPAPTGKEHEILAIARRAICSLGSFDRGLQDYYQAQLNAAIGKLA